MGRCFSVHSVVLCKIKFMGIWIKSKEEVNGLGSIKREIERGLTDVYFRIKRRPINNFEGR